MQNFNADKLIYKELSYEIIGILFDVFNELGYGYQEKYYEEAIAIALNRKGKQYQRQAYYKIKYKEQEVGRIYIDFIIENKIVLEIKKGPYFPKQNIEQTIKYLQATGLKLAILANFTPYGIKYKRILNPNNIKATD